MSARRAELTAAKLAEEKPAKWLAYRILQKSPTSHSGRQSVLPRRFSLMRADRRDALSVFVKIPGISAQQYKGKAISPIGYKEKEIFYIATPG